ncbi:MAG: RibD family protein [Granulosicoccus sp.]
MDGHDIGKLSHLQAESLAWQILLTAREVLARPGEDAVWLCHDNETGKVRSTDKCDESAWLWLNENGVWSCRRDLPQICRNAFDLYLPALGNRLHNACVIAHLGQSIDARIATSNGDSFYVTGEENRKHLHCLRALCDAIIVGSGTVIADDPQLTTRAVPGMNPVRVILDSRARLKGDLKVFNDGQARTIVVHQSSVKLEERPMSFGPLIKNRDGGTGSQVERWVVPDSDNSLSTSRLVDFLQYRGLRRLFVEGGGITVSRFFEERALDRLHVAVAPLLVGEGTQALQLAGAEKMLAAHRPPCAIYRMGEDILWDFDVSSMKNETDLDATADVDTGSIKVCEKVSRLPLERLI